MLAQRFLQDPEHPAWIRANRNLQVPNAKNVAQPFHTKLIGTVIPLPHRLQQTVVLLGQKSVGMKTQQIILDMLVISAEHYQSILRTCCFTGIVTMN
jgi:hypothetical protein